MKHLDSLRHPMVQKASEAEEIKKRTEQVEVEVLRTELNTVPGRRRSLNDMKQVMRRTQRKLSSEVDYEKYG